MDSGALVPDDIIIDMMIDEIGKAPAGGYVLDGFPRTVKQAADLDKALDSKKQKIDAVLNLSVDEEDYCPADNRQKDLSEMRRGLSY